MSSHHSHSTADASPAPTLTVEDELRLWPRVLDSIVCWSNNLRDVKVIGLDREQGVIVCELTLGPQHCNIAGNMHGGCAATLVDEVSSMALRLRDHQCGGHRSVSVNINTDYLAGAPQDSTILIEGRCHKAGRTLAFLSCEIRDKSTGQVYVRGSHVKFMMQASL